MVVVGFGVAVPEADDVAEWDAVEDVADAEGDPEFATEAPDDVGAVLVPDWAACTDPADVPHPETPKAMTTTDPAMAARLR